MRKCSTAAPRAAGLPLLTSRASTVAPASRASAAVRSVEPSETTKTSACVLAERTTDPIIASPFLHAIRTAVLLGSPTGAELGHVVSISDSVAKTSARRLTYPGHNRAPARCLLLHAPAVSRLAVAARNLINSRQSTRGAAELPSGSMQDLKVLIADDHRLMLQAIRLVLDEDPDISIV